MEVTNNVPAEAIKNTVLGIRRTMESDKLVAKGTLCLGSVPSGILSTDPADGLLSILDEMVKCGKTYLQEVYGQEPDSI